MTDDFDRIMDNLERAQNTRERQRTRQRTSGQVDVRSAVGQLIDQQPTPVRTPHPAPRYEDLNQLQRADQVERDASIARAQRELDDSRLPGGIGYAIRPIVDAVSDPMKRAVIGETAQRVGQWALSDEPVVPTEWVDAITPTNVRGAVAAAPGVVSNAVASAPQRLGEAAQAAPTVAANLYDAIPPMLPTLGAIGRGVTYGPWEDERRLQYELDVARGMGDTQRAHDLATEGLVQTGWAGLNAAFVPGDAMALAGGIRRIGAARTARQAANVARDDAARAPEASRVYHPNEQTTVNIDADGRTRMTYEGGYVSGATDPRAAGSPTEARRAMHGARDALAEDIATNQRREYYWTPSAGDTPDPRLAEFYRNTIGAHPPEGYAFSETPDGVMRLTRTADAAPSGGARIGEGVSDAAPTPPDAGHAGRAESPVAPDGGGAGAPTATERYPFGFRPVSDEPWAQSRLRTDQFYPVDTARDYGDAVHAPEIAPTDVPVDSLVGTQESIGSRFLNRPSTGNEPVSVYRAEDGQLYIIDGHHRVAGAVARGEPTVSARVYSPENPPINTREPEIQAALDARLRPEFDGGQWHIVENGQRLRTLPQGTTARDAMRAADEMRAARTPPARGGAEGEGTAIAPIAIGAGIGAGAVASDARADDGQGGNDSSLPTIIGGGIGGAILGGLLARGHLGRGGARIGESVPEARAVAGPVDHETYNAIRRSIASMDGPEIDDLARTFGVDPKATDRAHQIARRIAENPEAVDAFAAAPAAAPVSQAEYIASVRQSVNELAHTDEFDAVAERWGVDPDAVDAPEQLTRLYLRSMPSPEAADFMERASSAASSQFESLPLQQRAQVADQLGIDPTASDFAQQAGDHFTRPIHASDRGRLNSIAGPLAVGGIGAGMVMTGGEARAQQEDDSAPNGPVGYTEPLPENYGRRSIPPEPSEYTRHTFHRGLAPAERQRPQNQPSPAEEDAPQPYNPSVPIILGAIGNLAARRFTRGVGPIAREIAAGAGGVTLGELGGELTGAQPGEGALYGGAVSAAHLVWRGGRLMDAGDAAALADRSPARIGDGYQRLRMRPDLADEAPVVNSERAGIGQRLQRESAARAIEDARSRPRAGGPPPPQNPFIEPDTGRSVFGSPRRERQPLPPLEERAAQGALRGVKVTTLRRIAGDLGIESRGVPAPELRQRVARALAERPDRIVSTLSRYGISAALVAGGIGAGVSSQQRDGALEPQ